MIVASDKAIEKLRERLIDTAVKARIGFRIYVTTDKRGQRSFIIKLDRQRPEDRVIELGNVKAFLDSTTAAQIGERQIDYLDEPDGGFILKNYGPPA